MQQIEYLALSLGVLLSIIGVFFLINPNPKYVPKLTYRLIMKKTSQESAIKLARLYGTISLALGILFLIFYLI